jgi:hypothetical protein
MMQYDRGNLEQQAQRCLLGHDFSILQRRKKKIKYIWSSGMENCESAPLTSEAETTFSSFSSQPSIISESASIFVGCAGAGEKRQKQDGSRSSFF